jgi:hypothetical protein
MATQLKIEAVVQRTHSRGKWAPSTHLHPEEMCMFALGNCIQKIEIYHPKYI